MICTLGSTRQNGALNADVLDPDSTQTTKTVVGLLQKANLLGKGYHVYMDNYYFCPDLFCKLHFKEVFGCRTNRLNCKNLLKAFTKAKLQKSGECTFRRGGLLICVKWLERKDVTMLNSIHEAILVETGKVDREGKIKNLK